MKTCAYCGRENNDDATRCWDCGTAEFVVPAPAPIQPDSVPVKVDQIGPIPPHDFIPEVVASDEKIVCTSCHAHNTPAAVFCRRCGAPISFISTIGPMETLYAEGFAYRQALQGRPKFVVVLGIWLVFFPAFLGFVGGMFLILGGFIVIGGPAAFIFFALFAGLSAICAVMIYRVTRNFLTIPKRQPDAPDA